MCNMFARSVPQESLSVTELYYSYLGNLVDHADQMSYAIE